MKLLLSTGCLCALVMAGCGLIRQPPDDRVPNVLMVNTYSDIAIDNAILAQHTLYPYHFVSDAAVLNELGKRDLGVLAAHYKDYPGTLNVSRSDVPQPLYAARLAEVRKALMEAGVKEQRMTITDGLAGGDGMKSEQVVKIPRTRGEAGVGNGHGLLVHDAHRPAIQRPAVQRLQRSDARPIGGSTMNSRQLGRAGLAAVATALLAMVWMLAGCGAALKSPTGEPEAGTPSEESAAVDENRPPTLKTRYAMARLLAVQDRDDDAEAVLKQLLADSPDFMPAYCDLAEIQMRQQRLDDAVGTLRAGLVVDPHAAVLLNNLGFCRVMASDFARALDLFTEAAANMPQNTRYRANMALALGMLGRYDESLALEEQILGPAEAHHNLAVICAARGDLSAPPRNGPAPRPSPQAPNPSNAL